MIHPSFYTRFTNFCSVAGSPERDELRDRACTAFDGMSIPGDSILVVQLPLIEAGYSITPEQLRFLAREFARLKELFGVPLLHTVN